MNKPTYTPGPVLLRAQARLLVLRARDDQLKREIAHLILTTHLSEHEARRRVLSARGWWK